MTSIYGGLSDYIYSIIASRKGLIPMHIVRSILYAACIGIGYIVGFGLAHPSGRGRIWSPMATSNHDSFRIDLWDLPCHRTLSGISQASAKAVTLLLSLRTPLMRGAST